MDAEGPVEMTGDIASTRKVSSVQIDWEFPAKAYTLSVSVDGVKWSEVQSTDSNVLHSNHIALGAVPASKVGLCWRIPNAKAHSSDTRSQKKGEMP